MAMSLSDHHLRLRDLEIALGVLLGALRPGLAADVNEAVRALKSRGEEGAAALLEGEPARVAYRRN